MCLDNQVMLTPLICSWTLDIVAYCKPNLPFILGKMTVPFALSLSLLIVGKTLSKEKCFQ